MFISNMPSLSSNMAMEIHTTNGSVTFRYVKFLTTRGYVNVCVYIYMRYFPVCFPPNTGCTGPYQPLSTLATRSQCSRQTHLL